MSAGDSGAVGRRIRLQVLAGQLLSRQLGATGVRQTCLVIGGTGVTGVPLVAGLLKRNCAVTVLHTGKHKPTPTECPWYHDGSVTIVLASPFQPGSLVAGLGSSTSFDVVLSMYGNLKEIAKVFSESGPCRCGRFISIGGAPVYSMYGGAAPSAASVNAESDTTLTAPVREEDPTLATDTGLLWGTPSSHDPKVNRMVEAEQVVFKLHPDATHFRYPLMYGPGQIIPMEWAVVKRCLDNRPHIVLPDAGLRITTRCFARNAAEMVLRAVDRPAESKGEAFNVGDDAALTLRQWTQAIAAGLGRELEIVSMPIELATPAWPLAFSIGQAPQLHEMISTDKARQRLGHRDVVPAADALAETARWLAANPPNAVHMARMLSDPFDYATEDRLIAAWRNGDVAACKALVWPVLPALPYFYYGTERDQVKQHAGTYNHVMLKRQTPSS